MALGAGASGVIHKPFDEDELIAKAEVLLAA
jgi:DNA-binding response OmpR family regulator